MDTTTLSHPPSLLQELIEENTGSDILPSLYDELLFQLAGTYPSVHQKLRMIRGEIAKRTCKLVSLSQRNINADLTFDDIQMLLNLLKNRSFCLSLELNAQLEVPPRSAIDGNMDIPPGDHVPTDSNTNFGWSSATYHNAHSEPLRFRNTPFPAIPPPPICVEGVSPILSTVSGSHALYQDPSAIPSRSHGLYFPCIQA